MYDIFFVFQHLGAPNSYSNATRDLNQNFPGLALIGKNRHCRLIFSLAGFGGCGGSAGLPNHPVDLSKTNAVSGIFNPVVG